MNIQKYLLASLAAFVTIIVIEFVVNGLLLGRLYMELASVWRPETEMMQRAWLFYVRHALLALAFVFIYTRGYEKNKARGTVAQGARYGLYMGMFAAILVSFVWYVVLPIPGMLAVYWFLGAVVGLTIVGAVVGAIYRA